MADSTPSSAPSDDLVQYNAPDFGVIPAELMCDAKLSSSARNLGCLMWTYRNKDTGEAWPSQATLAARLDVTDRTVGRWMKELRKHGWMTSQHRISVDPTYKGNPGALIHTLHWNRTSVSENKGKPDKSVRSYQTNLSGTGRHPTDKEHTKEHTKGTVNSSKASISKTETLLLDAGVFPRVAARLVREYSEDRIKAKAEHWKAGELALAIEEDWQPQVSRSAAPNYAQGQFANFWDT